MVEKKREDVAIFFAVRDTLDRHLLTLPLMTIKWRFRAEFYDLSDQSCPSRVDKSNWLGGDTYNDEFDITVSKCQKN